MPRPRSVMREIRELLRLRLGEGLSLRMVSSAAGLPYTTVADHLERAKRNGLGWPLPETMDDRELAERLFAREPSPPTESRPVPDLPSGGAAPGIRASALANAPARPVRR